MTMGASGASGLGAGATGSEMLTISTWNLSGVLGGTLGGAPLTPYPSSGTMFSVRFIPALRHPERHSVSTSQRWWALWL